jgi:hypothetical protein
VDQEYVRNRYRNQRDFVDIQLPTDFKIDVNFENNRSQPKIVSVEFIAGEFGFKANLSNALTVDIRTPVHRYKFQGEWDIIAQEPFAFDISYLDFVVSEVRYTVQKQENVPEEFLKQLPLLGHLYRSASRSFPPLAYASAPVRSKPERTYNPGEASPSPDGEHIPYLLAQTKAFDKEKWSEIVRALGQFGRASGMFEAITIKQLSNTEGGPFQLIVSLKGTKSNIIDVGYGVSQALPIITDFIRTADPTLFLFQQPEVHLHPRAQAELASFFSRTVKGSSHVLFLETHSDHLIDRFRMEARDGKHISSEDVSILYFDKSGHNVKVHQISVDDLGNLKGAPSSYRRFFIDEELRSLGGSDV